jgi:hypothetical protein
MSETERFLMPCFNYPDGGRNQVVKEALYRYLIGGDAEDRELAPSARKPVRSALVTKKAQPTRPNAESGNQNPPVHVETPAATAGQYTEAAANIPSRECKPNNDVEEQVMAELRSMIQ